MMTVKRQSWLKKLVVSVLIVVLVVITGYGIFKLWAFMTWKAYVRDTMIPKEYVFPNATEMERRQKDWFETQLQIEIPQSARDIYMWRWGASLGCRIFMKLSFFSFEEASEFAEEFAEVPVSEFWDGKTSARNYINYGPVTSFEENKSLGWWNMEKVVKGKCCEFVHNSWGRFIVIDLDTNKVYLCQWST